MLLIGLRVVQGKWHAVTRGDLGAVPGADFCGRSRTVRWVPGGRGPARRTRVSQAVVAADLGRDGVLRAAGAAACLHPASRAGESKPRNAGGGTSPMNLLGAGLGLRSSARFQARYWIFQLPLKEAA